MVQCLKDSNGSVHVCNHYFSHQPKGDCNLADVGEVGWQSAVNQLEGFCVFTQRMDFILTVFQAISSGSGIYL